MRLTSNQIDGGGDPFVETPKIKVSQATVDAVKDDGRGNMGQAAANKVAYGSPGYSGSTFSPNAPVSAEYKEATKRVYPNAKATSPAASSGATNPKQAGPKSSASGADAARAAAGAKSTAPKNYGGAAAEKYKAEKSGSKAAPTPAKVKVSQATIDAIKKDGKAGALGKVKNGNPGYVGSTMSPNAPVSAEYKEGVRRLYQSPAKPKAKTKAASGGGGSKTTNVL
jgi:hypothetical protein